MFKRLLLAATTIAALAAPAYSAGTIPGISMSQQFDSQGRVLSNCYLYIIQAGTVSTPQNGYQDTDLTIPLPNPLRCDAAGRIPQIFVADGQIKVRLTNSVGVQQLAQDNILVIGASSGGGGGGTVDPTTVLATGDLKSRYGTGTLSGFVRLNGRTIGSAASGATERANADAQALFEFLWNGDVNLAVSGGRGGSAAADWAANKTIALPDGRGRVLAALDDMGSTAAGRLTATYFGVAGTTLGAVGGAESLVLTQAHLPNVSPTFTGNILPVNVTSTAGGIVNITTGNFQALAFSGGGLGAVTFQAGTIGSLGAVNSTGTFQPSGTISALGSGSAHRTVQPTLLITNYIKL